MGGQSDSSTDGEDNHDDEQMDMPAPPAPLLQAPAPVSAMAAGVAGSCIWRRWPGRPQCQASGVPRGCEARPRADSPLTSCESACGPRAARRAARYGGRSSRSRTRGNTAVPRDDRRRLDDDERRSPPGPQTDNQTHSHRSAFVRGSRRDIVRCSTSSWCRNARISS